MIIFDLDSTLADCEHRRYFICPIRSNCELLADGKWYYNDVMLTSDPPQRKRFIPDWKSFYEACDKDTPIKQTFYFLNELRPWNKVFGGFQIWSGRCESVREKTISWILKYSKVFCEYNGYDELNMILKMRPVGDYTPDDVLKERWLDEAIADGKTIDFVFDDRKKVRDMWVRRGIFVFDVSQGKGDF